MTAVDSNRFGATVQSGEPVVIQPDENKTQTVNDQEVPMVLSSNGTTVQIKNLNVTMPKPDEIKERIDAIANIIGHLTGFLSHLTGFIITVKSFEEKMPIVQLNDALANFMKTVNDVKPQLPINEINSVLTNAQSAFQVATNVANTVKTMFVPA